MFLLRLPKLLSQKRNRIVSRLVQRYRKLHTNLAVCVFSALSFFVNLFDGKTFRAISEVPLPDTGEDGALTINCLGQVDLTAGEKYAPTLDSVADLLNKAHLSLSSVAPVIDSAGVKETLSLLERHGVTPLCSDGTVRDQIFVSPMGRIAVISYGVAPGAAASGVGRLTLMRHVQMMKRKKADFVLLSLNNAMDAFGSSNRLCTLLSRMGADYIIAADPNHLDGGSTYQMCPGKAARSVYSLGAFPAQDSAVDKAVVVRLRLRQVQGSLQLFEETYFPYGHTEEGMVSLLGGTAGDRQTRLRGEIESRMLRIHPADRILTVGKVMELIHTPLPQEYQYLADFSVGKLCARSFDVMPGDVFFFREAFDDPNDLEPVNHKLRVRIAKAATNRGAMLVITFQKLPFACRQVRCDNVMEAHIAASAYLRKQFPVRTIGITGSIGKTSTKDLLSEVMKMRYNTVKSERNENVQVKIGLNLQKLTVNDQVYIQEIGGGRPGGASRHARMVLPEVTVVTNIGDAHIGNFGSREKLMANKLGIIEGMDKDGVLYLNGDDPLLSTARPDCKTVFYAVHNKNADYYAENLQEHGLGTSFHIVHEGRSIPVRLNVLGEYNVLNAVCCYAIGRQFGIPEEDILTGLQNFRTTGIRQNLIEVCGRKFFMDCYNASSASVKSALDTLGKIPIDPGNKRIAVIGDITGMGELTEQVHQEMGETILQHPVDHVVLFGNFTKTTYEYLRERGVETRYIPMADRDELNRTLRELIDVGDVAMFKGSSKVLLENSVDMTFGTCMTDQRLLDEREHRRIRKGTIAYNLFANYATAILYTPRGADRKVHVPDRVGSIAVVNIDCAFSGTDVAEVSLPETLRHIGDEAFMNCQQLTKVKLPDSTLFIGDRAFRNCSGLREITIPKQVLHIGREAFAGCTGLKQIVIPPSVVQIGKDAFADCGECRFIYEPGSCAEGYFHRS